MNRKKIALLLTGLVVTSGILTSCGTNNKTADNSSTVKQEALRRATDRQVTPYDEKNNYEGINSYQNIGNYQGTDGYPNVAYAEDIMDNSTINKFNKSNFDNSSVDYQMNPSTNYSDGMNYNNYDSNLRTSSMENNGAITRDEFNSNVMDDNKEMTSFDGTSSNTTTLDTRLDNGNRNNFMDETYGKNSNQLSNSMMMENSKTKRDTEQINLLGDPSTYAVQPTTAQTLGKINHVRTIGGSEVTDIGGNKLAPQGTAEVSFTLSGDVLTLVPKKNFTVSDTYNELQNNSDSLSTLIQQAYEETIADANTGFTSKTLTARIKLSYALRAIFGEKTGSDDKIKFIFKSNDNDVKVIPFSAEACFPNEKTCPDYIRHIIDLDAMNMGGTPNTRVASITQIPIKMMIRAKDPEKTPALQTNTNYTFVGIGDKESFKVNETIDESGLSQTDKTNKKMYVTGFNMGNFKTGKVSAKLDTKVNDGQSSGSGTIDVVFNVSQSGNGQNSSNKISTDLYVSNIGDKTYIDMQVLTSKSNLDTSGEEVSKPQSGSAVFANPIERTGTSIKFKPLVFSDANNTITKIEIEDDRGQLYKGQLVPVDSSKEDGAKYLEIVGLERSMPYVFQKLHITSKLGDKEERKTIYFAAPKDAASAGTITQLNNLPIRTTQFHGPKLSLVGPAKDEATLPDGLKVKSVKNDRTALRYILKPDNTEGTLGKITVNGLKTDEKSKVEKFLDSNGKVSYYTLTLSNLTPGADYGFLILELEYKDPQGNEGVTRQALGDINVPEKGQEKVDNTTETTALTSAEEFQIIVKEKVESKDSRSAEVPVFIDDIKSKFAGIELTPPNDAPDAKAVYENGRIKVTGLKPNTTTVCKIDFLAGAEGTANFGSNIGNGSNVTDTPARETITSPSQSVTRIPRYITITTPQVQDLDIKSATPTINGTVADFKFEFYSEPKSPIKSVMVKDNTNKEIKSTWDKNTNTLKLEGLKEKTEYIGVQVTFTLENSKTIVYTLDKFTTEPEVVKPTGNVAEFVQRVYKIALGREPEVEGWNFWIDKLQKKEITATEFIAENLMTQKEFVERQLSKSDFVTTMYSLIVNREPDSDGQKYWERKYDEYKSQTSSIAELRIKIAREMMDQPEFKELVTNLKLKY